MLFQGVIFFSFRSLTFTLCRATLAHWGIILVIYHRDHPFKTSAIFHKLLTPTPLPSEVFSAIRRQIWQIFNTCSVYDML